jgi:hypothetical protein
MATLDDGRVVHTSRVKNDQVGGVKVKNRWLKPDLLEKKKKR